MRVLQAKCELATLLELMAEGSELVVPVRDEGGGHFTRWRDLDLSACEDLSRELMLEGEAPRRPAKEVLFAQTATLFRYHLESADFRVEESPHPPSAPVIFGLRPCDGRAFEVLDTLLAGPQGGDPAYAHARAGALLVGIGCTTPGRDCFCTSVGGDPHSTNGLDVLATAMGDELMFESVSDAGREWLTKLFESDGSPLRAAEEDDADGCGAAQRAARERVPRHVDTSRLPAILERSFDSDVWESVAPACIGCGVCTFLCPSCRCFDIQEVVRGCEGQRVRVWDSCMFCEYTQEASGHNPRPRRGQRWRNRFYDKFHWSGDGRGNPACVGCGRCITHCPSGIDLVEMVERVVAEGGAP
jgi:ferredoxin